MTQQFIIIVSLLFIVGFLMHCLFAASNAVRDKKFGTKLNWFSYFWVTIVIRLGLTILAFAVYANNQVLLTHLLALLDIPFSPQYSLPVTKVTAPVFGYFADSILDFITKWPKLSWLSRDIPTYDEI